MKVLVVDDDNTKISRLVVLLVDQLEIHRDNLHVAHTVTDARRELAAQEFDLLILDVLLPTRPGDQQSSRGTVSLLEELSSRPTLRKPRYILGLTAYDEAILEAGAAFIKRTWTIIKFNIDSEEWKQQIEACVQYIRSIPQNARKPNYETDLCIVTALLTPELDAVIRLPWRWQPPKPIDDITFVRAGEFESDGHKFKVIAAAPTKMGMISAALLTAKLIIYARPRFVVMTGMCAGVRGKTNFGDVIISDPGWNWQSGKHFVSDSEQGFAISPDPLPIPQFIRSRAEQLRSDTEVVGKIRQRWPAGAPDTELRLRIGPMASGSPVVADSDIIQRIVEQNRNLLGVEMEAYGVLAAAAFASHPRPTAFACKAVCDFGDEEKSDNWQAYASYTSAEMMRVFFEMNMYDIRDLAGT